MTNLSFAKHEKINLAKHPDFNERWVQERIEDDPSIIGLGDSLRLLDRERVLKGGGRLDLLLADDNYDRRYEVELQLGKTDPSHIIRCMEYWDLERRKYPGYDHVAVIIAEDVTTRFLNVISLMSGSIPIIAIQLDALRVGESVLLNFVQVLDQTDLRTDDEGETGGGGGGGPTSREYWKEKAGADLLSVSDSMLEWLNAETKDNWEFNYLKGYFGLRANGVVNNFIHFSPKPTKRSTNIVFRNEDATSWAERFEDEGIPSQAKRKRLRISINR